MANLNWGSGEQCQNVLVNEGTKTILEIKKLGTSLKVIWETREHKQIFKGNKF